MRHGSWTSSAGSVATLQGFVHMLTGLDRVAEVVEDMNADPLGMAEAGIPTLTDLVRVLHPIDRKTAELIRVA